MLADYLVLTIGITFQLLDSNFMLAINLNDCLELDLHLFEIDLCDQIRL